MVVRQQGGQGQYGGSKPYTPTPVKSGTPTPSRPAGSGEGSATIVYTGGGQVITTTQDGKTTQQFVPSESYKRSGIGIQQTTPQEVTTKTPVAQAEFTPVRTAGLTQQALRQAELNKPIGQVEYSKISQEDRYKLDVAKAWQQASRLKESEEKLKETTEIKNGDVYIQQGKEADYEPARQEYLERFEKTQQAISKVNVRGENIEGIPQNVGYEALNAKTATPSFIQKVVKKYESAEAGTSKYVSKVLTPDVINTLVTRDIKIIDPSNLFSVPKGPNGEQSFNVVGELTRGFYEDVQKKPIKNVLLFGASFALPAVVSGVSKAVSIIPITKDIPVLIKVASYGSKAIGAGLAGLYLATTGKQIIEAPAEKRAYIIGGKGAELASIGAGSLTASYAYPRIIGFVRTLGKEYKPLSQIGTPPEKYPISDDITEASLRKSFKEGTLYPAPKNIKEYPTSALLPNENPNAYYVWHGAKTPFARTTQTGSAEGGLFGAPVLETYFTGARPSTSSLIGYGLPEATSGGAGIRLQVKGFTTKGLEEGYGWLRLQKPEYEAVVKGGTPITQVANQYFTKVNGIRIPIMQFKVADIGSKGPVETLASVSSRYLSPQSSSVSAWATGVFGVRWIPIPLINANELGFVTTLPSSSQQSSYSLLSSPSLSRYSRAQTSSKTETPSLTPPTPSPSSIPSYKSGGGGSGGSPSPPSQPILDIVSPPSQPSTPSQPSIFRPSKASSRVWEAPSRPAPLASSSSSISQSISKLKSMPAFKLFVKKEGKFLQIAGLYSKGKALALGEKIAGQTLSATFKIKPTNIMLQDTGKEEYRPSRAFRSYKVVKGVPVPLENTFIQKASFRLSSRSERVAIQQAKKSKGVKWL